MLLEALAVMGEFSDFFAEAGKFALSLNKGLLLLAQITALHFDDLVEILNALSLNLDSSAALLQLALKGSMSTAKFVVNFIQASDHSNLLASISLNSLNFFMKAGETVSVLINFVLLTVGVLASFVAVEALVAEDSFKLVEFTAKGRANIVLLLYAALKVAKAVLGVVNFSADFVSGHTEIAVVLLLVAT